MQGPGGAIHPTADHAYAGAGAGPADGAEHAHLSQETRIKVEAAKSFIENMYQVKSQSLQERLHRRKALEQGLQQQAVPEEERRRAIAEHEKRESDFNRLQRKRMTAEDFEPLTIIGRGAFGEVGINVKDPVWIMQYTATDRCIGSTSAGRRQLSPLSQSDLGMSLKITACIGHIAKALYGAV